MKGVFENSDGSIEIVTFVDGINPNEEMLKLENRPSYNSKISHGVLDDIDAYPNSDGAVDIQDYELDEATETVVLKSVPDQVRHFRSSWIWNGLRVAVDSTKAVEERKVKARSIRNRLLELSDKDEFRLQAPGSNAANLASMRAYRKSLRDLGTAIDADPENIVWPTKPVV